MTSQITPNSFLTRTGPSAAASTTVFFISGNPGLISYYHPFLSLLSKYLAKREDNGIEAKQLPALQLYGCSLGGFEINSDASDQLSLSSLPKSDASDPKHRKQPGKAGDYDLEDQIRFVDRKLTVLMETTIAARSHDPRPDSSPGGTATQRPKVILIGHSVGAYIAMEILRRHRETIPKNSSERRAAEPASMNDYSPPEFDIVGGAMLFPTVIDIAASPSGQKFTTLLSFIPRLAMLVGLLVRLLTFLLPDFVLRSAVRFVMKSPPSHALGATVAFLKSSGGVRQALHMATDEMRTITSDKWTDDVWGAATAREPLMKLVFYFGRNDHWVAEKTRDEIIALRGRKEGSGPTMLVCEEGLPHAFCLKHSDTMARKVAGMIREILT